MPNPTSLYDPQVGLLQRGTIVGYDAKKARMQVQLNTAPAVKGQSRLTVDVPASHSMFYNNGLFMGTKPNVGTPVVVGQALGGEWVFVSYLSENIPAVPVLTDGELLIQSNNDTYITLTTSNDINIGADNSKIHINTGSKDSPTTNLISFTFQNENHFTQGYREVGGVIKRDKRPNTYYDPNIRLEDDSYDSKYKIIGLDPTVTANNLLSGPTKNPPLVEHREIVYEFQYQSDIMDDTSEALRYSQNGFTPPTYTRPNRRKSRADTLSLSLVAPNYLLETIKGTVVDIFGNILDFNRVPIAVGQGPNTLKPDKSPDKSKAFTSIRALERNSVAYHFEINARKDFSAIPGGVLGDINDDISSNPNTWITSKNLRSRFFLDINKEGQFKLNVPASSETGSIPILARYENYSTYGIDDNGNPNKLWFRNDNLDIFLDGLAAPLATPSNDGGFIYATDHGSISIMDGNTIATPIDRITKTHIKHGTIYHDILQTGYTLQNPSFLDYQMGENPNPIDLSYITPLNNVVSNTIFVGGPNANAGGRSGSLNFDGSVELNVGANTVDRQSIWFDSAGGIVGNIGRDRNSRSVVLGMDGDFYLQVGGFGVQGDARFVNLNNGDYGAVLDLRISTGGGYVNMIRVDQRGITIMSPGNIAIHSRGDLTLTADHNMTLDAASITIQQRYVLKNFGGSI
jgi:hypothetical protein